jgi:hypothetical protein
MIKIPFKSIDYVISVILLVLLIGLIVYTNTLASCTADSDNTATTSATAPLPYQITIKLPHQFSEMPTGVILKDCENACFKKSSANTFITTCDKQPTAWTIPLSEQEIGKELHFQIQLSTNSPPSEITQETSQPAAEPELLIADNEDYAVYQFPDKTACREGTNPTKLGRYTQTELQTIAFDPNTYIKLFDELNDKPASRCTQPIKQQHQWQLDFKPYECDGKRQLIIISSSERLDRYARQIQKTLLKVFENQLDLRIPFTLVTIQPGRKLSEPLLQCEDLADLEKTKARRFIWQRLKDIRFGARDLRALQDLDIVNAVYTKERLQSVLYLTDNSNIPADIDHINDKDLSVPLITWKGAGIQFTILTTDACTPWEKKAEASKCQALSDETIEREFDLIFQ